MFQNIFTKNSSSFEDIVKNDGIYRTVHIQSLKDKNPTYRKIDKNSHLKVLLDGDFDKRNEKFNHEHLYYQNSTEDINICGDYSNNFIGAFMEAYYYHRGIIISPSDIWNMIMLYFSKFVDENAEILRNRLVNHQGQINLVYVERCNNLQESLDLERQWETGFFESMNSQIKSNIKNGLADNLVPPFSCATNFESMFTIATIMDSFQKYFSYGRMICGCGITDVKFMGTLEDWELLRNHLNFLKEYIISPGDKLEVYIEKCSKIIDEFINTYNGNVNLSFWNTVAATEIERIGSGGETQTNLNGWITYFIGIYGKCSLEDIPSRNISIPIKVTNLVAGTEKNMTLQGGFCGIHHNEGFYRPVLAMTIYHYQNDDPYKNKSQSFFGDHGFEAGEDI